MQCALLHHDGHRDVQRPQSHSKDAHVDEGGQHLMSGDAARSTHVQIGDGDVGMLGKGASAAGGGGAEHATPIVSDKGKGKARVIEPEEEEDDDDDDDDDDNSSDEEEEGDDDDDVNEDELNDLIDEVDMGNIVAPTSRRSTRTRQIDYASHEAMERAGFAQTNGTDDPSTGTRDNGHVVAADRLDDEDDDEDFKTDEGMEEEHDLF